MLCSLDLSEPRDLEFTLQIFGTATSAPEARFLLITEQYAIVCHCSKTESGIKVHIPRLEGLIPPGVHRARFEVILGDKIYVPIEDEVEIIAPVKIHAAIAQTAAPAISMKMSAPTEVTSEAVIKPLFSKPTEVKVNEPVTEEQKPVDTSLVTALLKRRK